MKIDRNEGELKGGRRPPFPTRVTAPCYRAPLATTLPAGPGRAGQPSAERHGLLHRDEPGSGWSGERSQRQSQVWIRPGASKSEPGASRDRALVQGRRQDCRGSGPDGTLPAVEWNDVAERYRMLISKPSSAKTTVMATPPAKGSRPQRSGMSCPKAAP